MIFKLELLIFLIFTCAEKSVEIENSGIYTSTLEITSNKLEISIDNRTSFQSGCIRSFQEANTSYLVFLNHKEDEIQFYDLEKRKLSHRVGLQADGPIGVNKSIFSFQIVSLDSIYVTAFDRKLYLINRLGKVLNSIDYINQNVGMPVGTINLSSSLYNNLVFRNNKIVAFTGPVGDITSFDQAYLDHQYVELSMDPQGVEFEMLPMTYPKDYVKDGIKSFEVSREYVDNKFIYSFSADHNLYVTSDFKIINKKFAASEYFKEIQSLPKDMDISKYKEHLIDNFSYRSIVYDKYRKVYYRFCNLSYEVSEGDNLDELLQNRPRQSIIILDKELNKIGETLLPEKTFKADNFFIAKEGLYLSNNSIYNSKLNKNLLSFTLLKLKRI